jgi:hypothetical protein
MIGTPVQGVSDPPTGARRLTVGCVKRTIAARQAGARLVRFTHLRLKPDRPPNKMILWYGDAVSQPRDHDRTRHAAVRTSEYRWQLIPTSAANANSRLISRPSADRRPAQTTFVDFFAGSGVVSTRAKLLGYRVMPTTEPYGSCQSVLHRLQWPPAARRHGRIRASHLSSEPSAAEVG